MFQDLCLVPCNGDKAFSVGKKDPIITTITDSQDFFYMSVTFVEMSIKYVDLNKDKLSRNIARIFYKYENCVLRRIFGQKPRMKHASSLLFYKTIKFSVFSNLYGVMIKPTFCI